MTPAERLNAAKAEARANLNPFGAHLAQLTDAGGFDIAGGHAWYPGTTLVAGWPKRDQREPWSWTCGVCRQRLHATTDLELVVAAEAHQCPACPECGDVFDAETWPTRHTRCDGEDVHDFCCRWCVSVRLCSHLHQRA